MSGIDYTNPSVTKQDLKKLESLVTSSPIPDPLTVNTIDVQFLQDSINDNIQVISGTFTADNIQSSSLSVTNNVNAPVYASTDPNGRLVLSGVTLSNTAGGNSGLHLVISVSNTNYKIKLESA
jgi:hypothetical protein